MVGAWLETTEVHEYAEHISEDLFSLLRKTLQLCSVVEKRANDTAIEADIRGIRDGYESDVVASSESQGEVLKRFE